VLSGVRFNVLDEGMREVPLTEEVVRLVKVGWEAGRKGEALKHLIQGLLPPLSVPKRVQHAPSVFSITLKRSQDEDHECILSLAVRPAEPHKIEVC